MYLIYRFTMITNLSEQFSALCGYTARIGYLLEVIDRIQADNLVDMAGNGVKGKWGSGNGTGGGNGDETDDSNYGSLHSSNSSREDSTDNLFRRATESTSVPLTTAEELGARTSVSAASTTATVNSPEHIIKLHHHPHRHQHSIAEDSNIAHNNHSHPPMQDDNDNGDKDDTIVINGLTLHIPPSSLSSPHSKESNTYSLLPPLISNLSLTLSPGTNLLISGANGSGKSSLLRSLAGLVSPTLGSTRVPPFPRSMFIPQSVYVPAHGSLMDVVGYGCCCSCLELESQDSSSSSPVPPTSPPNKSTPTTSNNNSNNRLLWHQLYLPPRPPMFWNRHQKSRASQGQCQHSNYCPTLANCVGLRTFTDDQVINCLLQKVELGYLLSRIDKQIFSTQGGDQLECVDDEVFVAAAGASNSDSSSTSPPSLSISISSHHEILYHQFDLTRLSPGELQRLHIARLLLWRPTWAFIDEGFSSIDVKGRRVLLDAVIQSGISVIMVTHGDTEERGVSTAGSSSNSIVWRQLSLERGSEGSLNNNSGNGSFKIIDLTTAQY